MGFYVNSGNGEFTEIRKDEYIDKSGLLSVLNSTLNTKRRLSCVSRPRRFGKSYACAMIAAYYDKSCDSSGLFKDLKISKDKSYGENLNKYNVLYIDIASFLRDTFSGCDVR